MENSWSHVVNTLIDEGNVKNGKINCKKSNLSSSTLNKLSKKIMVKTRTNTDYSQNQRRLVANSDILNFISFCLISLVAWRLGKDDQLDPRRLFNIDKTSDFLNNTIEQTLLCSPEVKEELKK